jgi:subtilisin-like proprotein convertase family protein
VPSPGILTRLRVSLDISHTFIGDLNVELLVPNGRRAVLHAQTQGDQDNIVRSIDSQTSSMLAPLIGQPAQGQWLLRISDRAKQDVGTLKRWSLQVDTASS